GGRTIKFHHYWTKKRRRKNIFNKKSSLIFTNKTTWKVFIAIIFTMMIGIVILIPTLIVMLPTKPSVTHENEVTEVMTNEGFEEVMDLSNIPVTVQRTDTGEIEEVPLEKYIISVVAAEMPAEFELEA